MKLSNKVLLGFFGFIFLYLTAAFAELRLTGTRNFDYNANRIAETADLSGFAYLKIQDIKRDIEVIGSDQFRLEVRSIAGGLLKNLTYEISGDTLMLSGFESDVNDRTVRISVFVPQTKLKGITVASCLNVTIQGLQQELLHISQNAARIHMTDNKISKIQMDAVNGSHLNMNKTDVDTLAVAIEGSQVYPNAIGLLQGSLKNNALLQVHNIREIQLKKDESSRLMMFQ